MPKVLQTRTYLHRYVLCARKKWVRNRFTALIRVLRLTVCMCSHSLFSLGTAEVDFRSLDKHIIKAEKLIYNGTILILYNIFDMGTYIYVGK